MKQTSLLFGLTVFSVVVYEIGHLPETPVSRAGGFSWLPCGVHIVYCVNGAPMTLAFKLCFLTSKMRVSSEQRKLGNHSDIMVPAVIYYMCY